jgi:probable F420-dependent oxidoreductase
MNIGIFNFITDYSMPITELAPAVEERGFDSLWLPEHTHIPTSRKSPYPEADELPNEYLHTLDPFVTLAAAATVTNTLKLGTGITLIIERDTITTAKSAATLDFLSGGRLQFGLGGGWNQEEAEHHGTEWGSRFKRLEEQMQALKMIFTEDEAEFHGKYVDFDPIWAWPKPAQNPHPPIYLGGETIHTLRRVVKYGDGWLPRAGWPEKVLEGIGTLRQLANEAGRDPSSINISVFAMPEDRDWISKFSDAGVDRLIFFLAPEDNDTTLRNLDRLRGFID